MKSLINIKKNKNKENMTLNYKQNEKDYSNWLIKDQELNVNSEEYDLALGQFGINDKDNIYYSEFLAALKK